MNADKSLLEAAKQQAPKDSLVAHVGTIDTLRQKSYSWRDIADFLIRNGVATDHTQVYRFWKTVAKNKNHYIDFFVPTCDKYVLALQESPPTPKQLKMLMFHYSAHNRSVTYSQLAEAAGYPDYKTANLQYGKLGRSLGEELDMVFAKSGNRDDPFYSSAIGTDNPFKPSDKEYELVMHHELAKAIEKLGWANLNADGEQAP